MEQSLRARVAGVQACTITPCSNLAHCLSSRLRRSRCLSVSSYPRGLLTTIQSGPCALETLLLRARDTYCRTQKPFCDHGCWPPATCSTQGLRQLGGPPSNARPLSCPVHFLPNRLLASQTGATLCFFFLCPFDKLLLLFCKPLEDL